MLKLIFSALLCANVALLAYGKGWLGTPSGAEREPQRIRNQVNTDQLQLLSAASALALTAAPAANVAVAPAAMAPQNCTDIGNFASGEARRFEDAAAALNLGARMSKSEVAVQEVSSHMVMIPPLGSKEAADTKAAQLKDQGVTNYFIMNDSPAKWGISLGVFKSEAAARTLLAALRKQGVTGAKIVGRLTPVTRQVFRFTDIDPPLRATLATMAAKYDDIELRACKT